MILAVVGLGKPSEHVISKTKHQRGVFGIYAIPLFFEKDALVINESSVCNFVRDEWLIESGFVHIDFNIKMVYIGCGKEVAGHSFSVGESGSIDWSLATSLVSELNIDCSYAVSIERLKRG